jgi:hypothetical protein
MTKIDLLKRVINKADPMKTYLLTMKLAGRKDGIPICDSEGNMTVKSVEEWLK